MRRWLFRPKHIPNPNPIVSQQISPGTPGLFRLAFDTVAAKQGRAIWPIDHATFLARAVEPSDEEPERAVDSLDLQIGSKKCDLLVVAVSSLTQTRELGREQAKPGIFLLFLFVFLFLFLLAWLWGLGLNAQGSRTFASSNLSFQVPQGLGPRGSTFLSGGVASCSFGPCLSPPLFDPFVYSLTRGWAN